MTIVTRNGDDQTSGGIAQPVDLDTPAPAVQRWQELVEREITVYHEGDAAKVIPFPRPAWADPDCDIIGSRLDTCYYASDWVEVPLSWTNGDHDVELLEWATMRVRAKVSGDGRPSIGLTERYHTKDGWQTGGGAGLAVTEATELAQALLAAVELIGGSEVAGQ